MGQQTILAAEDIFRRYRSYGLFGGAAVGAVVGLLVSGPNFHEWAAAQSLAVIVAFTVGSAAIGYFFLVLLFGASTGGSTWNDEQDEEHDRARRETTDVSAGNGNDGD